MDALQLSGASQTTRWRCATSTAVRPRQSRVAAAWQTCLSRSPSACGLASDVVGRYLQCYAAPFHPCATAEECTASGGRCSDAELLVRLLADADGNTHTVLGGCVSSGFYELWMADRATECPAAFLRTTSGCMDPSVTSAADCPTAMIVQTEVESRTFFQTWAQPATDAAQCLGSAPDRYGCRMDIEARALWLQTGNCTACHGTPVHSYQWSPGEWRTPVARPLVWAPPPVVTVQQWHDTIDYFTVETWFLRYQEQRAAFGSSSEAVCFYQLLSHPLRSLVCDCISSSSSSSSCYTVSESSLVSVSLPCVSESLSIETPSSSVAFSNASVSFGCVRVELFEVPQASMALPPQPPSVSFRLATRQSVAADSSGAVQNAHAAVVGQIASNGITFSLSNASQLHAATLCIRITVSPSQLDSPRYTAPDIGRRLAPFLVRPLFLNVTQTTDANGDAQFCADITFPGDASELTYFAVWRTPSAAGDRPSSSSSSSSSSDSYSSSSVALIYTLGALYCLLLLLLAVNLSYTLMLRCRRSVDVLPIWFYCVFPLVALCVFRIVYMFAYPSGTWESSQTQNFVVFELPTFFYLTAFIILLGGIVWILMLAEPAQHRRTVATVFVVFTLLTWSLFVATAVAVGVMSAEDGSSPCPGRVASEPDSRFRTLSISYQSIVIFFALLLAAGFCALLGQLSVKTEAVPKVLLLTGAVVVCGFLARCILFLVILGADFTSTVYMFCTLFFTEIVVVAVLAIIFLSRDLIRHGLSINSSGSSSNNSGGTRTVSSNKSRV